MLAKAIDHTINWGDQTYPVNTTLHSEFQQIVTEYVTMTYGGGPATPSLKPAQKSIPVKAIA